MARWWKGGIFGMGVLLWTTGMAEAHMRDYLVTQGYYTAKQGEFEVELFNDLNLVNADDDDTYTSRHQIELEYGITDRLQAAYYEVYTWNRRTDWDRDQFKLELQYRFVEAGDWPVDVALYTEYKNPNGPRERRSDAIENKLILSKNFGPWNWVGNLITEKTINTHSDWKLSYTAGVSYGLTPRTKLGLELKEEFGEIGQIGSRGTHKVQFVPGIYTSVTDHVRVLFGPAIGLTSATDDLQLRSIVEVEF